MRLNLPAHLVNKAFPLKSDICLNYLAIVTLVAKESLLQKNEKNLTKNFAKRIKLFAMQFRTAKNH